MDKYVKDALRQVFSDVLWFHCEFPILYIILSAPVTRSASEDNSASHQSQHYENSGSMQQLI